MQKVSGISGSEAHLLSLLPCLRRRGWDARMLVLHEGEPGAELFTSRLEAGGVPVELVTIRGDHDLSLVPRLAARLRSQPPRILHTHLVHADLLGQPAGVLAGVAVRASTKHGFDPFRDRGTIAFADRTAARLAHLNVAISRGLARYLAATEGLRERGFRIVHYGIADGGQPPARPGTGNLLCVGRLIPIKGHAVLLRAFAAARADLPELRLELAGAGPLEEKLRAIVGALGLGSSVVFSGHVAPIGPALERARAVVVPSLGEGFGMVALEAMERGRPVVASAVGGLPELVRAGRTGALVPPGDERALAAAIVSICGNAGVADRLGREGRRRALERFSEERCAERTELLYSDALATAGGAFRRARPRAARCSRAAAASSASRKSQGAR